MLRRVCEGAIAEIGPKPHTPNDRTMRLIATTLLALLAGSAASTPSAGQGIYDMFRLFTSCKPIGLVVEDLPQDAIQIGLTKNSIETLVRSRLRAARIYDPDAGESALGPYLYVNVNVVGPAFNAGLELRKKVSDPLSGWSFHAPTWEQGGAGTHGRASSQFILGALSQYTDEFIDEYLRVNEKACGKP